MKEILTVLILILMSVTLFFLIGNADKEDKVSKKRFRLSGLALFVYFVVLYLFERFFK